MNADIRARLTSLAVQSEEDANKFHQRAVEARLWGEQSDVRRAVFWEGLRERAANRAARCRAKLREADRETS